MKKFIIPGFILCVLILFFSTYTITIIIEQRVADASASSTASDVKALFEALDDRLTAIELIIDAMYDEENKTIKSESINWTGMNETFRLVHKRLVALEDSVDGYLIPAFKQTQDWVAHLLARCDCKHTPK